MGGFRGTSSGTLGAVLEWHLLILKYVGPRSQVKVVFALSDCIQGICSDSLMEFYETITDKGLWVREDAYLC